MKNILGLDLGTTSIGWALIKTDANNTPHEILRMGVRRVPLAENEDNKFVKGQSITTNADRTAARGIRRNNDRYKLRRQALSKELSLLGMAPSDSLMKLHLLELWQLRAKAVTDEVSLPELGRILYLLNKKRGYKHSSIDEDKSQRDFVKKVNGRYAELHQTNMTIGQYIALKLSETAITKEGKTYYVYRVKDRVFPRRAYEEEFDAIMQCQQKYHPDVLTNEVIDHIRNNIIFYQRDLRSCKHLVSVCDFEKRHFYDKDGKLKRNKKDEIIYDGPKVAPRTSPLFQMYKIWQSANNIRFHNINKEYLDITREQRREIALYMDNNEIIKLEDVKRILELNDDSRWYSDNAIKNGIKGNTTKYAIVTALSLLPQDKIKEITRFNLETEPTGMVDAETGELLVKIKKTYQREPLYRIWHIVYSIKKEEERKSAVAKFLQSFGIDNNEVVQRLSDIDFRTPGYGNISAKAICKILPYMMEGIEYSEACEYVGINHSNSLSKEENEKRELMNEIPLLKKNSLRQPTVEKILNQTINVFNSINADLRKNGRHIDEVRVELARELKQSKEERHKTSEEIKALDDKNNEYKKILEKEYRLNATHKNLLRYRLWIESNMSCFYCEQPIAFSPFANEPEEEREHILPKSLHYDDSFANQVCSCRKCNSEKGGRTALDYMRTTSHLQDYLNKVNRLHQAHKISEKKYTHLLTSYDDYIERKKNGKETKEDIQIWENPIDRQLRLSQYISRKAMEILSYACRDVVATSGTVTAIIRHAWGYDTILEELNIPIYRNANLTEFIEIESKDQKQKKEVIKNWTKRLDNRHHAIDALVVACTSRSIIQRINTLNASKQEMRSEISSARKKWDENSILVQWLHEKTPFSRQDVLQHVSSIFVSMKAGKKVTVPGKRKEFKHGKPEIKQEGLRIPRGPLHEEGLYGSIMVNGKREIVIRYKLGKGAIGYLFRGKEKCEVKKNKKGEYIQKDGIGDVLDSIVDKHIRTLVEERLNRKFPKGETYRSKADKAKKEGREYDGEKRCKTALEQLKGLDKDPIYFDKDKIRVVKYVRCKTGLNAVRPLRYNDKNEPITYALPKNNHHVAIYRDKQGNAVESVCTFWDAVERTRHEIPCIIYNPKQVWEDIKRRKASGEDFSPALTETLPKSDWTFVESLQQNEMFVMGMDRETLEQHIATGSYGSIGQHLYRVQTLSKNDYRFRLHTDSKTEENMNAKASKRFIRLRFQAFLKTEHRKVSLSIIGKLFIEP